MNEQNNRFESESRENLILRLGIQNLVARMSEQAKVKWELSDPDFLDKGLTEEQIAKLNKANNEYEILEQELRSKFREHNLSDDETARIMDYIWTEG